MDPIQQNILADNTQADHLETIQTEAGEVQSPLPTLNQNDRLPNLDMQNTNMQFTDELLNFPVANALSDEDFHLQQQKTLCYLILPEGLKFLSNAQYIPSTYEKRESSNVAKLRASALQFIMDTDEHNIVVNTSPMSVEISNQHSSFNIGNNLSIGMIGSSRRRRQLLNSCRLISRL